MLFLSKIAGPAAGAVSGPSYRAKRGRRQQRDAVSVDIWLRQRDAVSANLALQSLAAAAEADSVADGLGSGMLFPSPIAIWNKPGTSYPSQPLSISVWVAVPSLSISVWVTVSSLSISAWVTVSPLPISAW